MSNCISRRAFLKGAGASVMALGASGMLAGCKQNGSSTVVSVKVERSGCSALQPVRR